METVSFRELDYLTCDADKPTLLFNNDDTQIYWLGISENTVFRCNTYLLTSGDHAIIVDPGNRGFYSVVRKRVEQIMPATEVTGLILCHQDPDVAASMVDWLEFNPELKIYTTPRTNVLIPYYGVKDYHYVNVTAESSLPFGKDSSLHFIESPFLHFPGAFTTFDEASGYLFSGDIWAAVDDDWHIIVQNFDGHIDKMNLFQIEYMASNIACRGFIANLKPYDIKAILPQHGSIISQKNVQNALDYLSNLHCGTDIIYADLDQ